MENYRSGTLNPKIVHLKPSCVYKSGMVGGTFQDGGTPVVRRSFGFGGVRLFTVSHPDSIVFLFLRDGQGSIRSKAEKIEVGVDCWWCNLWDSIFVGRYRRV